MAVKRGCRRLQWTVHTGNPIAALLVTASLLAGCTGVRTGPAGAPPVRIDGSGTVYPITEAVAEEFQNKNQDLRVIVGLSETAVGFERFCRGEIDIADASRPITVAEIDRCAKAGITFLELPIAYDGIVVVVHPENTWADQITVAELKTLWAPEAQGKIVRWSQVRAGWPDREIHLYGPGAGSGTLDHFTSAIVGRQGAGRSDYTSSEDDSALVEGVASDTFALGFFGYEYFDQNRRRLKALPVDDGRDDNGRGPVPPSPETVRGGLYQPLSRPLFIYVSQKSMERPDVRSFVDYYLKEGPWLIDQVGAIQLGDKGYELVRRRLAGGVAGSLFSGQPTAGMTLEQLLVQLQ
jgi:phosphate transport system substrate-binding protein